MLAQIENNQGIITYDASLMEQLIDDTFIAYKGSMKLLHREFSMEEQGVVIRVAIYLKFGTSISKFSTEMMTDLANQIENNLELPVQNIYMHIQGIYSKRLVKRDILIEYNHADIQYYGD